MTPSTWEPRPGWLMLTPSKLPEKTEAGIILPESFTKKANSGIVIKAGTKLDGEIFLGQEVLFPKHNEYGIMDSDNQQNYYLIKADDVIIRRKPPKKEIAFKVTTTSND